MYNYQAADATISLINTDKGSDAVASHEAALDPHPQYLTQAEADALYAAGDQSPTTIERFLLAANETRITTTREFEAGDEPTIHVYRQGVWEERPGLSFTAPNIIDLDPLGVATTVEVVFLGVIGGGGEGAGLTPQQLSDLNANTSARHLQNTDSALATGTANEVAAAEIREHLDSPVLAVDVAVDDSSMSAPLGNAQSWLEELDSRLLRVRRYRYIAPSDGVQTYQISSPDEVVHSVSLSGLDQINEFSQSGVDVTLDEAVYAQNVIGITTIVEVGAAP